MKYALIASPHPWSTPLLIVAIEIVFTLDQAHCVVLFPKSMKDHVLYGLIGKCLKSGTSYVGKEIKKLPSELTSLANHSVFCIHSQI